MILVATNDFLEIIGRNYVIVEAIMLFQLNRKYVTPVQNGNKSFLSQAKSTKN